MLTIRLQRTGAKNQPSFRIVLAESHRAASKQALEVLGHYNPRNKSFGLKNEERLKYWLGKKVALSATVQNLLIEKKLVEGTKVKAWQPKKKEVKPAETVVSQEPKIEASEVAQAPAETSAPS